MLSKIWHLVLVVLIPFIFIACGSDKSDYFITKTGTLNDSKVSGVSYSCGSNSGITNEKGEFSCKSNSNNIEFHIGSVVLGSIEISNLNSFTIYPADLVGVDRNDTNNSQVVNILRFLQSLDEDRNPYNGIVISQETRDRLSNIETLYLDRNSTTEADLNSTLSRVNQHIIKSQYAIAHYEDTLRYEINSRVDSVAPAPAILVSTIPEITNHNTIAITINGERDAKVFVNGRYTNINIDSNHTANINLDLNSYLDGYVSFLVTLQDDLNQSSDELNITILKDTTAPQRPTISNIPSFTYNNTVPVTIYGEENATVKIDGLDVGTIQHGSFSTTLDIGGDYGEKSFDISLVDLVGNESEILTIKTIFSIVSFGDSSYYVPENFTLLQRDTNNNTVILSSQNRGIVTGAVYYLNTTESNSDELNSIISRINTINGLTTNEIIKQEDTDTIVAEYSLNYNSNISTVDLVSLLIHAINGDSLSDLPTADSSVITDNNFNLTIRLVRDSSGVIYIFISVVPNSLSLDYQTEVTSITNSQNLIDSNSTKVENSDSFMGRESNSSNIAEFLFVVDDSGSMSAYQNAVSQASQDFANAITNANVDFRIAIITTSYGIDGNGYYYYSSATRVLDDVGIIDNDIDLFRQKVIVGTGGSSIETGIYNAERALQDTSFGDSSDGILTQLGMPSTNMLSIIILSDEESQYTSRAYHSFDIDHNLFVDRGYKVYSIVNPSIASYSQYDDLATKTGGMIADITNTSSYSNIMNTIAQNSVGMTGYELSKSNIIESTISVTINGTTIPRGNTTNGWRYMESYNSIIFYGTAIPNEGDIINISYLYTE